MFTNNRRIFGVMRIVPGEEAPQTQWTVRKLRQRAVEENDEDYSEHSVNDNSTRRDRRHEDEANDGGG